VAGNREISGVSSEQKSNFTKISFYFDVTRIMFEPSRFLLVLTPASASTTPQEYGILKVNLVMVLTACNKKDSTIKNKRLIKSMP
jgi:hypothetical protein